MQEVTNQGLPDLRSKLFKALGDHAAGGPAEMRKLGLGEMAVMTGETKTQVLAALASLRENGFIAIDRNRITLNKKQP